MSSPEVARNKQERHAKTAELLIDIIDNRHQLDNLLDIHPDTIHTFRLFGIQIESIDPTDELKGFILPVEQSAEIDIEATNDGTVTIDTIAIKPSDQAPVVLRSEIGGLVTAEVGCDETFLEVDSLNVPAQVILPTTYRGTDVASEQLLQFAEQKSPEQHITRLLRDVDVENEVYDRIETTELETADDSTYSLVVERLYPHPSGGLVGTRMTLTESLLRRTISQAENDVSYDFQVEILSGTSLEDLEVADSDRFETDLTGLFNTHNAPILSVTDRHLDDVRAVLSKLTQVRP